MTVTKPIITNLTDTDLYKLTTSAFAFANHPSSIAEFTFKCRNKDVDLRPFADEIREQIHALSDLSITEKENNYLLGLGLFSVPYLQALRSLSLRPNWHSVQVNGGGEELRITVRGPWWSTTLYEIFVLAIVNEIYMTDLAAASGGGFKYRGEGERRLSADIRLLQTAPHGFQWTEFGTRRRYTREWQDTVLDCHLHCSPNDGNSDQTRKLVVGTSNVHLAMKYDIPCVGTMPHEYLQSRQVFSSLSTFQKDALDAWILFWRGNLGVALTDVVGMSAFERDFDYLLAKAYDGVRHDSGDPVEWGNRVIAMYQKHGINPKTKKAIWSDGLDFTLAMNLHKKFSPSLQCGFGIGTNVTNNMGLKPLNIVMKLTELDGQPVAKLSDAPGKTMCNNETYLAELRRAQGIGI